MLTTDKIFGSVYSSMDKVMVHSTTFKGGPLAMAAGLAALAVIDDEGLVENADRRGAELMRGLEGLKAKYDLINRYALRGAGIWALGYDGTRPELNAALAAKFLHDTTPPFVGIRTLPWRERDSGFPVSWVGDDISGIASYDIQSSIDGGPWATWLSGTTKTSEFYLGAAFIAHVCM